MVGLPLSLLLLVASSVSALSSSILPAPTSAADPLRAFQLSRSSLGPRTPSSSWEPVCQLTDEPSPPIPPLPPSGEDDQAITSPPVEDDPSPAEPTSPTVSLEGHLLPLPTDADDSRPPPVSSPTTPATNLEPPPPPPQPSRTVGADLVDAAFLSFEDWKALQLQAQEDASQPSEPSPTETRPEEDVEGSLERTVCVDGDTDGRCNTSVVGNGKVDAAAKDGANATSASSTGSPSSASVSAPSSKPPTPPSRRFNYASLDCSARVHYSSPLTRSPSALLHKSRDRYMLTPCSSKSHYVVIELCDEIRIDTLEVGNFEFFSSRVREVRVRAGESEGEGGDDEDDWKDLGTFQMENVRGMQSFKFATPTSFHRFLRLDFIGHFGNEYYCPVSLLRIYGMNQMEAYRYEVGKTGSSSSTRSTEPIAAATSVKVADKSGQPSPSLDKKDSEPSHANETSSTSRSVAKVTSLSTSSVSSNSSTPPDADASVSPAIRATSTSSIGPSPISSTSSASPLTVSEPEATRSTPCSSVNATSSSQKPLPTASMSPSSSTYSNTANMSSPPSSSISSTSTSTSTSSKSKSLSTSSTTRKATSASSQKSEPASSKSSKPSSASPSPSSTTTSSSSSTSARASPPPPPSAPTDSGESIYAFIIRRLTSLEKTSSLATVYIEQQSRSMRDRLERVQRELASFQSTFTSDWETAREKEREGSRAHQHRMMKSSLKEMDQRWSEFEVEKAELVRMLGVLDEEVVRQRRLLMGGVAVVVVILTAVLVDRFGSFDTGTSQNVLERVLARQKAEDRLRRTPRFTNGNNGGPSIEFDESHSGGIRRAASPSFSRPRPTSPISRSSHSNHHRPQSPPIAPPNSLSRPRIKHHSATPTKRAFSVSISGHPNSSSPYPAAASSSSGGSASRPRSVLLGAPSPNHMPGGNGYRRAARSAHLHSMEAERAREYVHHSGGGGMRVEGGPRKDSLTRRHGGHVVAGDGTPTRRFGSTSTLSNINTNANGYMGLGINTPPRGGSGSGGGAVDASEDEQPFSGSSAGLGMMRRTNSPLDGGGGGTESESALEDYEEGWTAATDSEAELGGASAGEDVGGGGRGDFFARRRVAEQGRMGEAGRLSGSGSGSGAFRLGEVPMGRRGEGELVQGLLVSGRNVLEPEVSGVERMEGS